MRHAEPLETKCVICGNRRARFYCRKDTARYFRCGACATIFQSPLPDESDMRRYVDTEYAQGAYREYVRAASLKYATFERRLRHVQRHVTSGRLLDVGCACGYMVDVALRAGFDARGIEASATAVEAAPPSVRSRLLVGDLEAFDGQAERFDVVTVFDVLEHTREPIEFLAKLAGLLRPSGLLVLTTPDAQHPLRAVMRSRWPMLQPMQHTVLFSSRGLRFALQRAGFTPGQLLPATKVLALDYLMVQVGVHMPSVERAYAALRHRLPTRLRNGAFEINIGELMALARRGA